MIDFDGIADGSVTGVVRIGAEDFDLRDVLGEFVSRLRLRDHYMIFRSGATFGPDDWVRFGHCGFDAIYIIGGRTLDLDDYDAGGANVISALMWFGEYPMTCWEAPA